MYILSEMEVAVSGSGNVVVARRTIDVGTTVPSLVGRRVATDVFLPAPGRVRPIALCCLPGGGMSRRYWDLRPAGDETYSFARWMAGAGFPVIVGDHLGTGDSTLPDGAEVPLLGQVAAANDAAFRVLLDELRRTGIAGGDPVPGLRSVGVGHSMGATMTIRQQAAHDTYDAVALLGFGFDGTPAHLPPEVLAACAEGTPGDERLGELTLLAFGSAYPTLSGERTTTGAGPRQEGGAGAVQGALDAAATVLLGAGGLLSMLPDNVAADAARLRVPVLVLNGGRDSLVDGRRVRAEHYPRAAAFASDVVPGIGHNHNIAPDRHRLWERIPSWVVSVISI